MINVVSSLSAAGNGAPIMINLDSIGNNPASIYLDFVTDSGVGTASVTYTFDTPQQIKDGTGAGWLDALPNLASKTSSLLQTLNFPVTAIRLSVSAYTSGTISLRVLQGGLY